MLHFVALIKGGFMKTKKVRILTAVGVLSAIAFAMAAVLKFPVVLFLKYDPKDIVIALAGLSMGSVPALLITVVSAFIEMITVSSTGVIGFIMNVISTAAFVLPVVFIYKNYHNKVGAVIGLISGVVLMTVIMLLWNYALTPIFMNMPREKVVPLLRSAILPFNLLKGGLNAAFTFLLYKPLSHTLRRYSIIDSKEEKKTIYSPALISLSLAVIVTCVMMILSYRQII